MGPDILVVGARRTGTTFVGKLLSLAPHTCYLNEPLNPRHGLSAVPFKLWYPGLDFEEPQQTLIDEIRDCLTLSHCNTRRTLLDRDFQVLLPNSMWFDALTDLFRNKSRETLPRRIGRLFFKSRLNIDFLRAQLSPIRPRLVVKDPLASLSVKWFTRNFGVSTVAVIRHPCAYLHSMQKVGWRISPSKFIKSHPYLSDARVLDILRSAERLGDEKKAIIAEWMAVYSHLIYLKTEVKSLTIIRQEDVALHPVEEVTALFKTQGLKLTNGVVRRLEGVVNVENKANSNRLSDIKRNPRDTVGAWKRNLSEADIDLVRKITSSVSERFYSDDALWKR
jgi:hypothetical protein